MNLPKGHKVNCFCCICKAIRGETKGTKVAWNKDLTNETDERVKKNSESRTGFRFSKKSKKLQSDSHKGQKLEDLHKSGCLCCVCKAKRGETIGHLVSEETREKLRIINSSPEHLLTILKGKDHPNWQGGKSFEEYPMEFNDPLKSKVRDENQHTCQMPGCNNREEDKLFPIHHIDYNKKNNNRWNLITLCRRCHTKTNYNRDYWESLFISRNADIRTKRKVKVFFTSDQHFFHSKIIEYCKRPFNSVEHMNDVIINNYNEVVRKGDLVYFLGDLGFFKLNELFQDIIRKLNGFKVLVSGSHDKDVLKKYKNFFVVVEPMIHVKIEEHEITLNHYSMRTWPKSHYNTWHLYGHSHGKLEGWGKSFDVGVDCHNFYPISLEQVEKEMDKRPDNFNLVSKLKEVQNGKDI